MNKIIISSQNGQLAHGNTLVEIGQAASRAANQHIFETNLNMT
jgi:hypothetical protein